jgi:putative transposase
MKTAMKGGEKMPRGRRHTPEQIRALIPKIQVAVANGKKEPFACREVGISEYTYYRWCKEYGGLTVDSAKKLKDLVQENLKLRRLLAELNLDKQALKKIATEGPLRLD